MNVPELFERRVKEIGGWRGAAMARVRKLVLEAAPHIIEEWKWDTPVWSSNGNVLSVGSFQDHVKINVFHGALLQDPKHLFNAGLEAKASRGIDLFEGDKIDESALKDLIRAAVELNNTKSKPARAPKPKPKSAPAKKTKSSKKAGSMSRTTDLPNTSAPAQRALAGAGIQNLKQLSKFTEKEIKALHGMGPNAIEKLRIALQEKGLSFAAEKGK